MKELEHDFIVGRVLHIAGTPWRVLSINPSKDRIRTCPVDGANERGVWSWQAIKVLILASKIEVE